MCFRRLPLSLSKGLDRITCKKGFTLWSDLIRRCFGRDKEIAFIQIRIYEILIPCVCYSKGKTFSASKITQIRPGCNQIHISAVPLSFYTCIFKLQQCGHCKGFPPNAFDFCCKNLNRWGLEFTFHYLFRFVSRLPRLPCS